MGIKEDFLDVVKSVKQFVKFEKSWGVKEFFSSNKGNCQVATADKAQLLDELSKEVLVCENCSLCSSRNNVVFGKGNPNARLLLIGEAPGFEEDKQGQPFVGKAGELLTKILAAINLSRDDVYIANVLKCRPPNNRNPLPSEIAVCMNYLKKQISIIEPELICTMGKFATQTVLNTDDAISRMRGKSFDYNGIETIPTFHPAYLLRNPNDKRLVWEDMKKIRDILQTDV